VAGPCHPRRAAQGRRDHRCAEDPDRDAQRLYEQRRDSKNKLYALHAPEVECIAKGKARTPYEFGVKTSVAVTAKEGVVVGMRSMPGAPYDGHTLHSQLEQMEILTGVKPTMALADRGYRGVPPPQGVPGC
jgi:IS5 family transposase